jgi:hypothetical protein
MFALKPAPKSRPTPPDVILSVASRFLRLPEIAPLRFPVGTRSRRISPRFCSTSSSTPSANLALPAKFPGICTYTNRATNAFRISTCKISRLKTVQNQHLRKKSQGRAIPVRNSFAAGVGHPRRRKAITGGGDGCIRAATRCAR